MYSVLCDDTKLNEQQLDGIRALHALRVISDFTSQSQPMESPRYAECGTTSNEFSITSKSTNMLRIFTLSQPVIFIGVTASLSGRLKIQTPVAFRWPEREGRMSLVFS